MPAAGAKASQVFSSQVSCSRQTAVMQGNKHFAEGLPVGLVMPSALLAYEWSRLDVSVRVCPQRLVRYASLESDISSIPHACVMD